MPVSQVETDLDILRNAVTQVSSSMFMPQYAKEALQACLRILESQERELQDLRSRLDGLES